MPIGSISLLPPAVNRISRITRFATALIVGGLAASGASAQANGTDGAPDRFELRPFGALQTILSTTTAEDVPERALDVRRARVGIAARYGEAVSGRAQVDLASGTPSLVEAYLDVVPRARTRIRAGRAFRPFGLLSRTSSTAILPIERGLRIRGVSGREHQNLLTGLGHTGREWGVQGSASSGGRIEAGVQAGVFLPDSEEGSRLGAAPDLSARASVTPVSGLTVGASVSHRPAEGEAPAANARALDASLERGGLRVMAEAARGDAAQLGSGVFTAGQLWAGYRVPLDLAGIGAVEPTGRISYAALDGADTGTLLTPGVTLYLGARGDRLMLNHDRWRPATPGERSQGAAKISLHLLF